MDTKSFITLVALTGILYSVAKKQNLAATAGYTFLFAAAGAVIGYSIQKIKQ